MTPPRTLLVISAQPEETLPEQIARGEQPRRDYFELQRALEADLLLPADVWADAQARVVARAAGPRVGLAWLAFRRRRAYDAIYSDGEGVGLPLAALLRVAGAPRGRPRHTMLTHYLSPAKKRAWFRLGVATHLDLVICHSSAQYALATTELDLPTARVRLLPYFADERFWRPDTASPLPARDGVWLPSPMGEGLGVRSDQLGVEAAPRGSAAKAAPTASPAPLSLRGEGQGGEVLPTICAVGLEFRDYGTLIAAARGLDAQIEIAAASHWSHHSAFKGAPELPPNVHVAGYDYVALRHCYARSRLVVVPLREVDNQAGVTVILEAMAMGKPVVVTGTRGQTDVVRDRRSAGRGRIERQWWPGFVDAPDLAETIGRLPTGFYVAPGDAGELRRAIAYLLAHPDVADELGRNARRVVEACFTLDAFVARFADAIRGEDLAATGSPTAGVSAASDGHISAR
jgi:glycosyltransferase involved in cell wall biosynthesis